MSSNQEDGRNEEIPDYNDTLEEEEASKKSDLQSEKKKIDKKNGEQKKQKISSFRPQKSTKSTIKQSQLSEEKNQGPEELKNAFQQTKTQDGKNQNDSRKNNKKFGKAGKQYYQKNQQQSQQQQQQLPLTQESLIAIIIEFWRKRQRRIQARKEELKKIVGEHEPTIEKFIKVLRSRVSSGIINVREVFACFDQDRDGYVSKADFYKTFDETACDWNSEFIKGLFEKLDIQGLGELSQEGFYFVLAGEDEAIIDYQKILADITLFRKQMQAKFKNIQDFQFAVDRDQLDTITKSEFNSFMQIYGGDIKKGQIKTIFQYLCRKQKSSQSLTLGEFSELYEAQAVIKKQKSQEIKGKEEESCIKNKEQDKIMLNEQDKKLSTLSLRKEIISNEEDKLSFITITI